MRKKVIFLDIDGVLINREAMQQAAKAGHYKGHGNCVAALNWLTSASFAGIVVSSTWRLQGLEKTRATLASWGVRGEVVGVTPELGAPIGARPPSEIIVFPGRGAEIQAWLAEHWYIERFVILDDDRGEMGELADHLVQTEFNPGLTMSDAKRAFEMLRGG